MLKDWKHSLLHNWSLVRIFRLTIGIILIAGAWKAGDMLVIGIGGFFSIQALLNYGCCATGSCSVDPVDHREKQVSFEEVKNNKKLKL